MVFEKARVFLGSTNASKVRGVERAFNLFFQSVEVIPLEVETGVSAQPSSVDETMRGAMNRAEKAAAHLQDDAQDCYVVGIEAGEMRQMRPDGCKGVFMLTCACVMKDGSVHFGFSPGFELPRTLAKLVEKHELSKAVALFGYDEQRIKQEEGLIGVLSHGKVLREHLNEQAVVMALLGFIGGHERFEKVEV